VRKLYRFVWYNQANWQQPIRIQYVVELIEFTGFSAGTCNDEFLIKV